MRLIRELPLAEIRETTDSRVLLTKVPWFYAVYASSLHHLLHEFHKLDLRLR